MKKLVGPAAAVVLVAATLTGCAHHGSADLSKPATQDNFGVQMAQMNLWREAMFRFQRAVEIKPDDAMAHNNLAVAYEANGDFEKAAKEYKEALRLDRGNSYIQKNYSRYTEFMSRSKKRQQKPPVRAAAAKPADANATPATATPAAPPDAMGPAAQPPTVPGTSSLPPGILSPPEVPLPAPPPQHPPGGF